jgi:hypothetical protein
MLPRDAFFAARHTGHHSRGAHHRRAPGLPAQRRQRGHATPRRRRSRPRHDQGRQPALTAISGTRTDQMLSSCSRAARATYGPNWVYRVRAGGNVSSVTAAARGGRARTPMRCRSMPGRRHPDHHRISARPPLRRRHHRTDRVDAPRPPPVRDHSLPPEVSGGSRANRDKPERSEKRPLAGDPCGLQKS